MIDFSSSYMTFTVPNSVNTARIRIDSAAFIEDDHGDVHSFYLIAPCRSERMYDETALFQMPNYEFCGVFSATHFMLMRTHWVSERDNREVGYHQPRFESIQLDIRRFPVARSLTSPDEIIAATLANQPLVAQTELVDQHQGRRVRLEYPIKTMNVRRQPAAFQIDTGPLIVPTLPLTSPTSALIECFEMAYVVYCTFDRAEFILRRPHPVGLPTGPAIPVTDYTAIETMAARHQVLTGVG